MVPLDKNLQESIFENKRRVDEIWKYMPSYEDEFLMLLCRCIYDKRTMPQKYMDRIKELFRITNMDKLQEYYCAMFRLFQARHHIFYEVDFYSRDE